MNEEYFGQKRKTYQDSNEVTCQVKSIEVYMKGNSENTLDVIDGLAVVTYKSKQEGQIWSRGKNIFKISYNFRQEKIVEISNIGNGYFEK